MKKYKKLTEKYVLTKQDMKDLKEYQIYFHKKFMDTFNKKFNTLKVVKKVTLLVTKYGYESIFTNSRAIVWISSEINENGITGPDDVGKTFIIQYKRMGENNNIHWYHYERDIHKAIEAFKKWLEENVLYLWQ